MNKEYKIEDFNDEQLKEIYMGKLQHLDTNYYFNPNLSEKQMRQIRLGLEDKLDVFCKSRI